MAIPDHARTNFQTLLRAARDDNLALMECTEVESGETRYVLCAVGRDGDAYVMTRSAISRRGIPTRPTSRHREPPVGMLSMA